MAKIINEKSIRELHRKGSIDARKLKKIEPKPIPAPSEPSKDEKMLSALLEHVKGLLATSENAAEANRKIMAHLVESIATLRKPEKEKPANWSFDIERNRDGFISKVNARAV